MIDLTDIAYVRSSAEDLEASIRFATEIVGMELVARDDSEALLRVDERHHCLSISRGRDGILATGLTVADLDALESAETELERRGAAVVRGDAEEAAKRRVAAFLAFDDPAGNHVELVVDQAVLGRPVGFSRDAGITEFGHICLDAPSPREAAEFWSTVFSARLSDRIGEAAYLMRIDPVHHKLAIFANEQPGLCHINLQVGSLDSLMRNWRFLQDRGVEIQSGPGRHPTSTAVFVYFSGPANMTYEYSLGVMRIEDPDWRPRVFPLEEPGSIDCWMGPTRRVTSQEQIAAAGAAVGAAA